MNHYKLIIILAIAMILNACKTASPIGCKVYQTGWSKAKRS